VANIKSAKKAARQAEVRRARNMHYKSTMRTKVKKVREAVTGGDSTAAQTALSEAAKYIDHVASKGVIQKRTASRKISRLARSVHGLSAS
jgi:small subunit ribosomal protein S20